MHNRHTTETGYLDRRRNIVVLIQCRCLSCTNHPASPSDPLEPRPLLRLDPSAPQPRVPDGVDQLLDQVFPDGFDL